MYVWVVSYIFFPFRFFCVSTFWWWWAVWLSSAELEKKLTIWCYVNSRWWPPNNERVPQIILCKLFCWGFRREISKKQNSNCTNTLGTLDSKEIIKSFELIWNKNKTSSSNTFTSSSWCERWNPIENFVLGPFQYVYTAGIYTLTWHNLMEANVKRGNVTFPFLRGFQLKTERKKILFSHSTLTPNYTRDWCMSTGEWERNHHFLIFRKSQVVAVETLGD